MDNLNTSKLENQLINSINKLLHQQPVIVVHERLNLLASNLANSILKKEASLDSKDARCELIPDALRYEEINFIFPLKETNNLSNDSINNSLVSYIKEKYIDIISCGINSIGTAIRVLSPNEILAIILVAYLKPTIPVDPFNEKFAEYIRNPIPANDLFFLINLLNNFRQVINLPILTPSPVAEERLAAPPNMKLVASYETSCSATYAIEVFQALISEKNFNNIISDIWQGFALQSQKDNSVLLKFWKKKEFVEYVLKLTYNKEINHQPFLDVGKLVGYSKTSSGHLQQKQRPGRKAPTNPRIEAWNNISASLNAKQGPPGGSNVPNNFNKNRGGGKFQKKYSPRQQQQQQQQRPPMQSQQQVATPSTINSHWDLASKALTQEQKQLRKSYQTNSSNWGHLDQPQQQQSPPEIIQSNDTDTNYTNVDQAQAPVQPQAHSIWSSFNLTESFDDKNNYRNLPADMKRSHVKNTEQQKQQGRRSPRQHQPRQQQNQQQQQQQPPQQLQVENDANQTWQPDDQWKSISSAVKDTENATQQQQQQQQQQPAQPELEDSHAKWREIRNYINTSYDDKNEFQKLAPELRSTHTTVHTNKKETEKQRTPRREKPQSKLTGYQQRSRQPPQQQQQQVQQPVAEPEKEVVGEPQNTSIWSIAVKDQTPYDDKNDVRKLPVELRRSHHELEVEDKKKKKQNRPNQERKEPKKQERKQNQQQRNRKADPVPEEKPLSKAASVWSNIKLPLPSQETPKPILKKSQQNEIANSASIESTQQNEQQQQKQNIQKQPEPVNEQQPVQLPEQIQEEQQQLPEIEPVQEPRPVSASASIWSSITESLEAPKKQQEKQHFLKSSRSPQPQTQPQPEPQQEPEQQVQQPQQEPAQQEAPAAEYQEESQQQQPENQEEEVEEVKNLAPPPQMVNAWATLQTTKKYDDSNDYRKIPVELRRSHITANEDQNKQKKNQKNQKNNNNAQEQKNSRRARNQKQPLAKEQPSNEQLQVNQQDVEIQLPEEEVQQQEEVQQPQVEKKSSWAILPEVPYDDKYHLRKLPAELRRSHNNQPIDKSKKDKKAKKEKEIIKNDRKAKKEKEIIKNPLIHAQHDPEEQVQPADVPDLQPEAVPEPEPELQSAKKFVWSNAIGPDETPYDDKRYLSKIPPQFRRSHKVNEEKPKEQNKPNRERDQNGKRNNQNNRQKKNEKQVELKEQKEIQEQPSKPKNVSPWASLTITPSPAPKPKQPKSEEVVQKQEPEKVEVEEQKQPEPQPEPVPEPEIPIFDEPAPALISRPAHSAWTSINLK